MRKKWFWIPLCLAVFISAGVLLYFYGPCRPYGDLTAGKVASVKAMDFGGNTYSLTEQQKRRSAVAAEVHLGPAG